MEVPSAITLVNCLVYKPGWTISATDHRDRFEGAIQLHVEYPVRIYDRADAPEGYPHESVAKQSQPLLVGRMDDDTSLYRAVIDFILRIEEHEAREALRVEPTYWAPFHPHRINGITRWGAETADLTFGLV